MIAVCTHCDADNEIADSLSGKIVQCKSCQEPFLAPLQEDRAHHCSNCGKILEEGAIVCMACGLNMESGEFLRTNVKQQGEELPAWHNALNMVADLLPGLFRPLTLVLAIVCFGAAIGVGIIGLAILGLAPIEGMAISAFAVILYAQAWSMLLSGSALPMSRGMNDFETKHWYVFCIAVFGPFVTVIMIIMYVGKNAT